MSRRITELTPAQRDRMGSFAQEWIRYAFRTEPLTEEEWDVWQAGARKCYELAGKPFPKTVVRVSSPLVGAYAAPIANWWIAQLRSKNDSVWDSVWDSVGASVWDSVWASVGDSVRASVRASVWDSVWASVGASVWASVRDSVRASVGASVWASVWDSVRASVGASVRDSVRASVGDSVRASVRASVGDNELSKHIEENWSRALGGRISGADWYSTEWTAFFAFFRDICGLELPDGMWEKAQAWEDANSAGWWWPFEDFVMVCDTPTELHHETIPGAGTKRLHCETGPAISWADGFGVHMWHGVRIPEWVIVEPTVERALKERNSEIRRCAFEAIGWDTVIASMGLHPIATAPDPANAPHELALYRLPTDVYNQEVNLLLMTNGSPDRSGQLRLYGETCPASITDPVEAAAWQYAVPVDVYRRLERRT
jgi:hypothetical protein